MNYFAEMNAEVEGVKNIKAIDGVMELAALNCLEREKAVSKNVYMRHKN